MPAFTSPKGGFQKSAVSPPTAQAPHSAAKENTPRTIHGITQINCTDQHGTNHSLFTQSAGQRCPCAKTHNSPTPGRTGPAVQGTRRSCRSVRGVQLQSTPPRCPLALDANSSPGGRGVRLQTQLACRPKL